MPVSWNCVLAWTAATNPNQLRVRVHCRWRVTRRVSWLVTTGHTQVWDSGSGIVPFSKLPRKWVQHERSAPVGTLHHRLVSNAQKNLRASGPNVLPRIALSFSVYVLLCVCTCSSRFVFFAARVSVFICISGCILKRKSGPPRESLRRHPNYSIHTRTQKVTSKPRMTKEGPSPRKETLWTSLSLSRVGPARPCAQVGKGHPSVRKVDPMLLQLAGRVKPSTPCCPCTLQKSFRHDKPETSSLLYYNPMNATWVFKAACKYLCDGLVEKLL